jgi:DNA-binding transcriptional MerR regulator
MTALNSKNLDAPYTAGDIVRRLGERDFKYTTHALRKQVLAGCIPTHSGKNAKKHRRFTEQDVQYFEATAVLRSLDVPLKTISIINLMQHRYLLPNERGMKINKFNSEARKAATEILKIVTRRIAHRVLALKAFLRAHPECCSSYNRLVVGYWIHQKGWGRTQRDV